MKEAMHLPEENLHLPNSVKDAIEKYKAEMKLLRKVKHEEYLVIVAVMALVLLILSIVFAEYYMESSL